MLEGIILELDLYSAYLINTGLKFNARDPFWKNEKSI